MPSLNPRVGNASQTQMGRHPIKQTALQAHPDRGKERAEGTLQIRGGQEPEGRTARELGPGLGQSPAPALPVRAARRPDGEVCTGLQKRTALREVF